MKIRGGRLILLLPMLLCSCAGFWDQQFLGLNPENQHYFIFRGKPLFLLGSTEHYGAVINQDFEYKRYLDELAVDGLNVTRTFTGIYVEPPGAFTIQKNTLAPATGRFLSPWSRSGEPGYINGGNKFDLEKWDEAYFSRLKDFVTEAGKRNIIVELSLFSNFYDTLQWKWSPLYAGNNVNRIGKTEDYKEVLSLKHPEMVRVQEEMVRKIILELKDFDNLYYEICNEPYFGDTLALREWEEHMTAVVVDAEKDFSHRHLISNNVANHSARVKSARKGVSLYTFHYARPPVAVGLNFALHRVIGDNETGFDGTGDAPYRKEAWDFFLAGGALFNHLDYSFTADQEDGSWPIPPGQPGGGGKTLRKQLQYLGDFMKGLDFVHMRPMDSGKLKIPPLDTTSVRGLYREDEEFAFYLHRKDTSSRTSDLSIDLPAGTYELNWFDTKTAMKTVDILMAHPGGWARVGPPPFVEDLALVLRRK